MKSHDILFLKMYYCYMLLWWYDNIMNVLGDDCFDQKQTFYMGL